MPHRENKARRHIVMSGPSSLQRWRVWEVWDGISWFWCGPSAKDARMKNKKIFKKYYEQHCKN